MPKTEIERQVEEIQKMHPASLGRPSIVDPIIEGNAREARDFSASVTTFIVPAAGPRAKK